MDNGVEAASISLTKGYIGGALPDVGTLNDDDVASVVDITGDASIRTFPEHHYSVGANVPNALPSQVVVSGFDAPSKSPVLNKS